MISRSLARWAQLALATVAITWMLMAIVAAGYVYNVRWDLSTGDRFTLSDHAHQVLARIDKPVRIRAFIRTEDGRNPFIRDLLWQVSRENPNIEYDIVDVNRNPAMAAQYGVSSYGSTVVESGGKRADFSNPTESLLMSASAPRTAQMLSTLGYRVVTVDIDEFEKLEGCVTCLSVRVR